MNRLRDLREDRNLTLDDVAAAFDAHPTTISKYELGQRALTADLIGKFCSFYGVTADYLLGRSSSPLPVVSESDTAVLAAYHAAPLEIRRIVDTALAPYAPAAEKTETAAS